MTFYVCQMQVSHSVFKLFSRTSKYQIPYHSMHLICKVKFGCRIRGAHTEIRGKIHSPLTISKLNSTASYTLQSRILNYFKINKKYLDIGNANSEKFWTKHAGLLQDKSPEQQELIRSFDNKHLALFILSLDLHNSNLHTNEKQLYKLITFLDGECSHRLHYMKQQDVLLFLYAWMNILPNKIVHLKFYNAVFSQVEKWVIDPKLSMQNYIQIVFYSGLRKKSHNTKKVMQLSLDFINKNICDQTLSIEELCVITNAFFKTGTKIISQKLLNIITATLHENLDLLLLDPALFVTLIKALRHAQNYDYTLLDTISENISANKSGIKMTFTAKVHLLALYAGALYSRCNVVSALIASCQNDLKVINTWSPTFKKSDHLSKHHRSKDLCRFLWAVSCLNCTLEPDFVQDNIIPELSYRYDCGEYNYKPNEIIDSLLSLWMLGFKVEKLLLRILSHQTLNTLQLDNKIRFNSRLALLLTCASIESPGILNSEQIISKDSLSNMNEPSISKSLITRPLLKKVYNTVNSLSTVLNTTRVTYKYPIPHLHIIGIEVNMKNHTVFLEVLDPTVCLYNSVKPHGLMQLKLRLMKSLYGQPIIIDYNEIENLDEGTSIYEVLEEKISSACKSV